jgi:hypothetical protein
LTRARAESDDQPARNFGTGEDRVLLQKRLVHASAFRISRSASVLAVLLWAASAHATTYYVRTDGNDASPGLANTSGGSWRTINYAANHVSAGDVVRVQAGTYVENAAPGVDGTAGKPITLVADGAVTTCGMSFNGRSYIRVIGFSLNPSTGGCSAPAAIVNMSGTNTGLEFWNNDLGPFDGKAYIADYYGQGARCDSCIILGGSVHDIGNPGSDVAISVAGDDVFVGYVSLTNICYVGMGPTGNRQRYVNDNFAGFIQCNGAHPDFFYIHGLSSLGYSNSLVESTFGTGTITSTDNKEFHAENQQATTWNDNVWRFNVTHDLGSGFFSVYTDAGAGASNRWRFYNNSILNCERANNGIYNTGCGGWAFAGSAYINNTLFYRAWADASTINPLEPWGGFGAGNTGTITADYNLAFDPGGSVSFASSWTNQTHKQSNVDPQLTNVANNDYTLQSTSGARAVGGPLTTASGGGSNSTSLTVAPNTGSFFIGDNSSNLAQYSGQLVPGDFIIVGATPTQVVSVSGDVVTLTSAISWNDGDPVYFGSSSTIDIGACDAPGICSDSRVAIRIAPSVLV